MSKPYAEILSLVQSVSPIMPKMQLKLLIDVLIYDGHDVDEQALSQHYKGVLQYFKNVFEEMPKTYETQPSIDEAQESLSSNDVLAHAGEAIVWLHYFVGGCDWWITEKDISQEQLQAYGVSRIGSNRAEFGYISIAELIELEVRSNAGIPVFVELDFYWQPTMLKDIPEIAHLFIPHEN